MGAAARIHRYRTPLALALVLVLAGSATTSRQPGAADQVASPSAAGTDPGPASVTRIEPQPYPTVQGGKPAPAVRISATRPSAQGKVARVDIADVLLTAYRSAAASAPASCHLPVSLLAAIGQVESGSLADAPIDARHRASVLGPVLDGRHGFKAVKDTDGGRWDGNRRWDRAVGPLQFIPSTWRTFGVDGDGDGVADPQDVEDAAATAAAYLCYGGRDLSRPSTLKAAVLAYNASAAYEALVLTYQKRYAALGLDRGISVVGLSTVVSAAGAPVAGVALGGREAVDHGGTRTPARGHEADRHERQRDAHGSRTRDERGDHRNDGDRCRHAGRRRLGGRFGRRHVGQADRQPHGHRHRRVAEADRQPERLPHRQPRRRVRRRVRVAAPAAAPPPPTTRRRARPRRRTAPHRAPHRRTTTDPSVTDPNATCPPCPTAEPTTGAGTDSTGGTGSTGTGTGTGTDGTCTAEDPSATAASPSSAP